MRLWVSIPGNLLGGFLAALIYAGYSMLSGTQAQPAILGGVVMSAITFAVLFIVTRAIPPKA
jgi:hypothetical protein